ncbi:hemolysin family protein [Massilia pseudoviolaceinigra]|uniref:hemolysin family protein n=1 Tax=Massilia pseudoviolaceinigra TaxID=3057165 RepID=UPI002796B7B1|nr:hemolysin family protein [Massilia sp. CCM 9206]MDQ1922843.1 hemolysin family protein [Massilia sp. CCM 9206]
MELLIILVLILLNGVFSMSELALVSAKRVRLEKMAGEGRGGARAAMQLADDPSAFLSTVQIGITVISIFNGAFGEASLTERLAPQLAAVPVLAPYARPLALAVVVAGITLVSILLGELVPKRIAIQYPEFVASVIAPPLHALSRAMAPLVRLLSALSDLIMRVLGMGRAPDSAPTADEISGMLRESADAGVLDKTESDIAERALRLDDQRLDALMTPRADLQLIDLDGDRGDNLARIAASPFSRFPVVRGDPSHVLGVVDAGELFAQAIRQRALDAIDIGAAMHPALLVPATVSARGLLEQLRQQHAELALVVDEHGQLKGMVTLNDLMAALIGVLPGNEAREPDAVRRDDGSWLLDGDLPLARLRELLAIGPALPGEASGAYQTLAGFVLEQLGHVPAASDRFVWERYRFEVVDMDRHRIDRVLVSELGEAGGAAPAQPR